MIRSSRQMSVYMEGPVWGSKGGIMEEKEYEVTIREVLQRKVRQRAGSEEEAQDIVEARYWAGEIILESDDFFDREFRCREAMPVKEQKR